MGELIFPGLLLFFPVDLCYTKASDLLYEEKGSGFIAKFVDTMANAKRCPVDREMPEKMKEKPDYYLTRKREPGK